MVLLLVGRYLSMGNHKHLSRLWVSDGFALYPTLTTETLAMQIHASSALAHVIVPMKNYEARSDVVLQPRPRQWCVIRLARLTSLRSVRGRV